MNMNDSTIIMILAVVTILAMACWIFFLVKRYFDNQQKERLLQMKIDEHKAIWLEADAKEQEFRAEGELEDFTGRKQNLDD